MNSNLSYSPETSMCLNKPGGILGQKILEFPTCGPKHAPYFIQEFCTLNIRFRKCVCYSQMFICKDIWTNMISQHNLWLYILYRTIYVSIDIASIKSNFRLNLIHLFKKSFDSTYEWQVKLNYCNKKLIIYGKIWYFCIRFFSLLRWKSKATLAGWCTK